VTDREWILLNPGPANTSREVKEALVTPDSVHREPEFFEVMRDCRERLVRLAGGGEGFAAVLFHRLRHGRGGGCGVVGGAGGWWTARRR